MGVDPDVRLDGFSLSPLWRGARRALNLRGAGAVTHSLGYAGVTLRLAEDGHKWVRLFGSGNPYTAAPVYPTASGGWSAYPGATLANVYEANGVSGLAGKVVKAWPTPDAEWRFTYRRNGTVPACSHTFRVLDSGSPVSGAVVSLVTYPGGATVGTCTTGADGTCEIGIPAATAQYTASVAMPPGHAAVSPYTFWGGCETATGCPCSGGAAGTTPAELFMHVTNSTLNGGIFQPCTLLYQATPSAYAGLSIGPTNHFSVESFTDSAGDVYRYLLRCESGLYVLRRCYATSIHGSPFLSSNSYHWSIGSSGNRCQDGATPGAFALPSGQIFLGGDPTTVVTIDTFGPP